MIRSFDELDKFSGGPRPLGEEHSPKFVLWDGGECDAYTSLDELNWLVHQGDMQVYSTTAGIELDDLLELFAGATIIDAEDHETLEYLSSLDRDTVMYINYEAPSCVANLEKPDELAVFMSLINREHKHFDNWAEAASYAADPAEPAVLRAKVLEGLSEYLKTRG